MTRHLDRQEYLPGCMWSVLHILDYHHWHSSKKRKHRRRKHTICCGYPKTISFQHYADEAHDYLDADAVPLIDEQKAMDAKPTDRNSAKARIKAIIAKEMSKRSQMQQTASFRRLRSLDSLPDWSNPIVILDKTADSTEPRLHVPSLDTKNNSDSTKLSREISDVLEIFKINKNMFLQILEDPDIKATNFNVQLNSNAKARRLKKSGSFPLGSSPDNNNRHLKPSTLEHKSRETWSFPKGENFRDPGHIESKSLEDFLQMPKGLQANDTVVLAVSEESGFSPAQLSQGSNKHGRHHSFMGHLKYMMKKIKHGLGERKGHNSQISIDSGTLEDISIRQDCSENLICNETSSSSKDSSRSRVSHMSRVSSLNESMDRYARLLDYGLTREAKWHQQKSKSLRLTIEDKIPESGYRIKSFKRKFSLQDSNSFYPFPIETTREELLSEIQIKNVLDCDGENFGFQDAVKESELQKNMVEEGQYEKSQCPADCMVGIEDEIINTPENQTQGPYQDQDFKSTVSFSEENEEQSHVSVLENHITDQTNFPELIGLEFDNRHNSSMNLPDISDNADFDYVKDVLELSGLTQQGYLGSWHSLDQPLSPTLFKELEIYLHHEQESSSYDDVCNHQLLFDSINEVLLHMYASSLAYFPKNFSFGQRVRPLPKGSHIVEEVWKRISSKWKMDQSLDDIVATDLAKDETWLDLQLDLEDIALDLEELIFDELVDEIVCS